MTNNKHTSLPQQWEQRWHAIEQAGGRYQYIMQQMKEHGFLVERKPIDNMSPTERERYKKQLKQEAAEQHKIKKDAWQAYKANHIVYLGHGIYWSDDTSEDKWDATDGAKRLLENQLALMGRQISDFSRRIEIGGMHAILQLLEEDMGVSFLYESAAEGPIREGRLMRIDLVDFSVTHDFTFIWEKGSLFGETYRGWCREMMDE